MTASSSAPTAGISSSRPMTKAESLHRRRLVFQLELAEKQRKLRCRPADPASGYLDATARAGSYELDGGFLVELATCEDVETGRVIDWPSSPLTLRGSFEGLPQGLNRGSREVSPLD
jgi:hypothetical protein